MPWNEYVVSCSLLSGVLGPPQIEPMIEERTVVMDIPFMFYSFIYFSCCECMNACLHELEYLHEWVCMPCLYEYACLCGNVRVHVDA